MSNKNSRSENIFRFQWTIPVAISIIVCLAMIMLAILTIVQSMSMTHSVYIIATIAVLLGIGIIALFYLIGIPLSLRPKEEYLEIRKFLHSATIPWEAIKSISALPAKQLKGDVGESSAGRGFGFGYMGKYHTRELGYFRMYATSLHNLVVIETDARTFVIGVPQRDRFLDIATGKLTRMP